MGIPNLLRFLKPFIQPVHIKKYAGKRVGIDAYSWLHKGAYSCSMELCMDPNSASAKRYISYFMHHISLLRHHEVVPVVVFDGCSMPCKAATDEERRRKRELNLVLGKQKLDQGNTAAAIDLFRKAVHITPSMAYQLIQILRSEDVEFVVAPYEADAQLAYLATLDAGQGGIAAVVTEDSDLIAYCCPAIIFKMDRFGNGEEFIMKRTLETDKDGLSFRNFDNNLFTGMCILAGCDFLPSVSGIGTKRAYSFISKYKDIDRVISTLKLDKRYTVPDNYADSFWRTLAVFNHARIYDVKEKLLKHLKPLVGQYFNYLDGDLDILGPALSPSIARGIAEGKLNPVTLEAFDLYSGTISPREFIDTPALKVTNQLGPLEIMTQKSCVTTLTSWVSKENTTVSDISTVGKNSQKGFLALGNFFLHKHSPPVEGNEVGPKSTPENNPFKKRKLTTKQGQETVQNKLIDLNDEESVLSCSSPMESSHPNKIVKVSSVGHGEYEEQNSLMNESPVSFCSSSAEQSAKSLTNKISSASQKYTKRLTNESKTNVNGKSGILKFFMRL